MASNSTEVSEQVNIETKVSSPYVIGKWFESCDQANEQEDISRTVGLISRRGGAG